MNETTMDTQYQFDLMISFAEEDRNVAAGIKDCLAFHGVSSYYYPDHPEENWARTLGSNLKQLYEYGGRMGLVLFSQHYVSKQFTQVEFEALNRRRLNTSQDFLLIIRLDNTLPQAMSDLPSDLTYMDWDYNPGFFAELIVKKLVRQGWKPTEEVTDSPSEEVSTGNRNQQATGEKIVQTGDLSSNQDLNIQL